LQEVGAVSEFLFLNRTGEKVLVIAVSPVCGPFLQKASEQSALQDLHRRTEHDYKPDMVAKVVLNHIESVPLKAH
jgi:hypothetical protein